MNVCFFYSMFQYDHTGRIWVDGVIILNKQNCFRQTYMRRFMLYTLYNLLKKYKKCKKNKKKKYFFRYNLPINFPFVQRYSLITGIQDILKSRWFKIELWSLDRQVLTKELVV